jgi:hypothetical protein
MQVIVSFFQVTFDGHYLLGQVLLNKFLHQSWPGCRFSVLDGLDPRGWYQAETCGVQVLDDILLCGVFLHIVSLDFFYLLVPDSLVPKLHIWSKNMESNPVVKQA